MTDAFSQIRIGRCMPFSPLGNLIFLTWKLISVQEVVEGPSVSYLSDKLSMKCFSALCWKNSYFCLMTYWELWIFPFLILCQVFIVCSLQFSSWFFFYMKQNLMLGQKGTHLKNKPLNCWHLARRQGWNCVFTQVSFLLLKLLRYTTSGITEF